MTLSEAIYTYAKTVSGLTAILGSGSAMKFWPVAVLETKTPPFAFYEEEKDASYQTHDGPGTLKSSVVKFTAVGVDPDAAEALAAAFESAFSGFRGKMSTVPVQGVLWQGSSPSYQWTEQDFAVDCTCKFWFIL